MSGKPQIVKASSKQVPVVKFRPSKNKSTLKSSMKSKKGSSNVRSTTVNFEKSPDAKDPSDSVSGDEPLERQQILVEDKSLRPSTTINVNKYSEADGKTITLRK